jgi:hypothetical protein
MKLASRLTKIVGATTLAALLVGGLTACGSNTAYTEEYLNVSNVQGLDCPTAADDRAVLVNDLQATADFVNGANSMQSSDIIELNEGITSLEPLSAVLDEKIEECGDSTATITVATEMSDEELEALIKALTVSTIPASAVCKTDGETTDGRAYVAFQVDSLLGVPPRLWPDAISTAITATEPSKARVELQEAICKDPLLGATWLTFMATTVRDQLLAATGIDLIELNPRLAPYTDVSQITPLASAFVPLLNVDVPTKIQLGDAIAQNVSWQQDAALVNTLLERFAVLGIEARQSLVNYHLTDYALDVDSLPMVGINDKQENLPALIFSITEKGQCGEITTFGANVGDKRPELFTAKDCKPTTPPKGTPPGNPPSTPTTPPCVGKRCVTDVTPPSGWTPQGPGTLQPNPPPAKNDPIRPETPLTADPGIPIGGATPAPPVAPAPNIPAQQQPTPSNPGTPITDPDN